MGPPATRRRVKDGHATTRKPRELEDLRTIGAATARWLRTVGIPTVAELRRVGAPEAYGRVVYHFGRAANRSLLWALAGALSNRAYNSFSDREKQRLCKAAGISPPPKRK